MALGEVNIYDGVEQYSYALVSEPSRLALFVLARDVDEYETVYKEEATEFLDANGFEAPINNPEPVYQGDDCLYPED